MFEELRVLLENSKPRTDHAIGRIIDCLKQILHFKNIDSNLGTEYLLQLLPTLRPFVLRQGFYLINENDQYVLIEGELLTEEAYYGKGRAIQVGRLVDLRQNASVKYVAQSDCHMIRLHRGTGALSPTYKKLLEGQRNQIKKFKEYEKKMIIPQQKIKLDFIAQNSFFSVLGTYDRYELASNSLLKEYSQATSTHEVHEEVDRIGCIISGKVKLVYPQTQHHRDKGYTWYLCQGDWIGLEEYLWEEGFKSSGEVQSIAALVLWIPKDIFKAKFNAKVNCRAITRLVQLIETKKMLFDRSFSTRRRKEEDMQAEEDAMQAMNPQLLAKITALQPEESKRKKHFRRARQPTSKQQELQYPEDIIHKMSNLNDKPVLLPRLQEKLMLFPEEYAKSAVSMIQQKELERLKPTIKSKSIQTHSTLELNPETLYRTIHEKVSNRFGNSRRKVSFDSTIRDRNPEQKARIHFNCSIYNNFRVGKHRESSLPKTKTLTILTSPSIQ